MEVFEMFGGDLPVMHLNRKPVFGKEMGDHFHNDPVDATKYKIVNSFHECAAISSCAVRENVTFVKFLIVD
ncbi:hypothetical protein [Paenibacillus terreus]|uniref:hypothetical protein n=1 Tax=Paenibacillus terreus TaxID=1387834 RepID=UPI0035CCF3C8